MNTSLKTAVQAVIAEWEEHGFATDGQMKYLCKALEAEQAQAVEPVTDEENERFSQDVSNFEGADPEATKYALDEFLKNRTAPPPAETMKNGAHRWINLDLLGAIAGALSRAKNAPNILEKVRGLIKLDGGVGRDHDAPYPGMIEAFEAHYGQSFTDKDWRNEAGIWAASWGCAVRQSPTPSGEHVPEAAFGNTERAELIAGLREHATFMCIEGAEKQRTLKAADMLEADASRITKLESSLDFYQRRVELLQTWQSKMRDPERTIACDIIANGQTLPPENAGDRYKIPVEAQQVAVPVPMTDVEIYAVARNHPKIGTLVPHLDVRQFARAIEAHHKIGKKP